MEDRSLDEFLETDGNSESEASTQTSGDDSKASPSGDVEPARATAHVVPGGAECEECGGSVSRLWPVDGTALCRACKEW